MPTQEPWEKHILPKANIVKWVDQLSWSIFFGWDNKLTSSAFKLSQIVLLSIKTWFQRSFEFTSRVIILVLFSYAFKLYVLIPIFGRWILMTAWILTIETNYHQNAWAEKAFQMIMGFLNVFLFFNMKDGSSKDVIIIYYSLNFLEGNNHKY